MERVSETDSITKGDTFFLGLLLFRCGLGVRPAHLSENFLIRLRCRCSIGVTRHFREQAMLNYARNLCALHGLAPLVPASGKMIHSLQ